MVINNNKKVEEDINVKEEVEATFEFVTYLIFYKNFCFSFKKIKQGDENIILSGLFLHLTFESLVSYVIRIFISMVYGHKDKSIKNKWADVELGKLDKKIKFLQENLIINSKKAKKDFDKIYLFIRKKLNPLRNKIVHGHEISEIIFDNGSVKKSKLLEMISEKNICLLYDDFLKCVDIFLNLFNDAVIPMGVKVNSTFMSENIIKDIKNDFKKII